MPEKTNRGAAGQDALLFFGFLLLLVVVWIARGATGADVRGVFLNPPSPVGPGGAYGPQINGPLAPTTTPQTDYSY